MKTLLIAIVALAGLSVFAPNAEAKHRHYRSYYHDCYPRYSHYDYYRPRVVYYQRPVRYYYRDYDYYPRHRYYSRPRVYLSFGF